jgi:mono/diheme cytochrome c family protein
VTEPTRPGRFALIAVGVVALTVAGGWAVGTLRRKPTPPAEPATPPVASATGRGAVLFQVHCASCHGPDGRGDGPVAATLRPPPRDLTARPWRGEVGPEYVRRIVTDGLSGTAMPAFRHAIPAADLDPLVAYTLDLARRPTASPSDPDAALLREAGFADLRGSAAPPLRVTDAAGKDTTLADLKGRLVLIHFWGTACLHCQKEMPGLKRVEDDLAAKGLTVLHVCTDADDAAEAQRVVSGVAAGLRAHVELTGLGLARFEASTLPTVWLIGPDGAPIARTTGARDWTTEASRRILERWLPRN